VAIHAILDFVLRHGYFLLAGWVFLEQAGLPAPSPPLLLAAGALAGMGRLSIGASLVLCTVAAVAADMMWYLLGRTKGIKILQWLCKISLEPDSCVRRTEGLFEKQGARSLLFAKFLPGLSAVATALAGIFQMRLRKFLLFDALGNLLWTGTYLALGYLFTEQIERIAQRAATLGGWFLALLALGLTGYLLFKYAARRKSMRDLRIERISVEELKRKIDAGEQVVIVDLRHSVDFEAAPETIPGAFHMDAQEVSEKAEQLTGNREVILYCT